MATAGYVWFNRHSLTGAVCGRAKPPGPNPWTRVAWLQSPSLFCLLEVEMYRNTPDTDMCLFYGFMGTCNLLGQTVLEQP